MAYVDGFVIPIKTKNMAAYRVMAKKASVIWKEHGALEYYEAVGEDLQQGFGMPFPKLCKCAKGETVVFSWILYKSKAHRDSVNKKVMKDPRIGAMMDPKKHPFDVKRMAYGGFEVFVKAVR